MSTSRPSTPASLSSSNTIAVNADQVWLVDQTSGSSIPPLSGSLISGGNITVDNATYVTDSFIGKSLVSSGSGEQAIIISWGGGTVGAYPFAMGGIFTATSLPADGGGSTLMTFMDSLTDYGSSGIFARFYVDHNTGVPLMFWRAVAGDTPGGLGSSFAFTPSAINAWAIRADAYNQVSLVFNGNLDNTVGILPGTAGWDSGPAVFGGNSFLAHTDHNEGQTLLVANSNVRGALWWRAHGSHATSMTDSALQAWTADPWTILETGAGVSGSTTETLAAATPSAAGALAISGHLT